MTTAGMTHFDFTGAGEGQALSGSLVCFDFSHFYSSFRLFCLFRGEDHYHISSVEKSGFFDHRVFFAAGGEAFEKLGAEFGMCHFSAEEFNDDFDFVALFEEFERVVEFRVEIVGVDTAFELYLFKLDYLAFFALFFLALFFFETVFPEIHYFTDRGNGIGSDLDKVELRFIGESKRFGDFHNAELVTVSADDADFVRFDLFVYSGRRSSFGSDRGTPPNNV